MEHFRDTATVLDSPSDGAVTISTENGYKEHRGPLRTVWNDEYLEAVIDKKTGRKSYLVYVWITYTGGLRGYGTASFQSPDGPRSVSTTMVVREKSFCAVGDCTYTDRLTFPVDPDMLRRLAAQYASGTHSVWAFKLAGKSGSDYTGGLSNAEIAGLLARVDSYENDVPAAAATTTAAGAAAATAGAAAAASLKKDFGVGGMAVAASADQVNRAGVVIIAVSGGSIAQKSGIIVGDIVYEFAGQRIGTPAELQAAVAASASNQAVAIKLYRGTTVMTVNAQF
jgi:membrane-associated protease RseP (regulator of RpoE activity)